MKSVPAKLRLPKALADLQPEFARLAEAEWQYDLDSALCRATGDEAPLAEREQLSAVRVRSRVELARNEMVLLHLIRLRVGDPLTSHSRYMRSIEMRYPR